METKKRNLYRPLTLHTWHRVEVVDVLRAESIRLDDNKASRTGPGIMLRDLAEAYAAGVTGDLTRVTA